MPIVAAGAALAVAPYTVTLLRAGQRTTLRRGDQVPSLAYVFPAEVDLDGASVRFLCESGIAVPASAVDASTGTVRYDWTPGDLAVTGVFRAEFEATLDDGRVFTGPPSGYLVVEIIGDLG